MSCIYSATRFFLALFAVSNFDGTLIGDTIKIMKETPYLTVIIPCYNEQKNLEQGVLAQVYDYLAAQNYAWELIVVNDESTDGSKPLVEKFVSDKANCSLIDIPHGGKPAAIWGGIQQAHGKWLLFTDMDQSTPIGELAKLLPRTEQGYEIVIGSRGMSREGFSVLRQVGSFVFRTLRGAFLLRGIKDTQCGFKLFRRDVATRLFPRLEFFERKEKASGWKVTAYDVELLHLCEKAGYQIHEVTVEWCNADRSDTKGHSGEFARYMRESVDMARQVLRVTRNQFRGLYDDV